MSTSPLTLASAEATRDRHHPRCFVCAPNGVFSLNARYEIQSDGTAIATTSCPDAWEGYPGLVHGGIVASLVDGAMTNCLFGHGIAAVTADLQVRYRHPVRLEHTALVQAQIERATPPLYVLKSTIHQRDELCIIATGKFMQQRREQEARP